MRHLVQQNEGNLGVYASIEQSGNIKLGDQVEWLAPS
jgi:MOSC domain-containing protein YiiM